MTDLPSGQSNSLGWWGIAGSELLDLLRRAHAGENPDLLYAEAYANSEHERVEGNDDHRG